MSEGFFERHTPVKYINILTRRMADFVVDSPILSTVISRLQESVMYKGWHEAR